MCLAAWSFAALAAAVVFVPGAPGRLFAWLVFLTIVFYGVRFILALYRVAREDV
jgi:hypothetical protein